MNQVISCNIPEKVSRFEIHIESGLLNQKKTADLLKPLANRFAILADKNVENTVASTFLENLREAGINIDLFSFAAGEKQKNRKTVENLQDRLFEAKYGRDSCIIALGGGTTTDIGGYIASTYCRGVPLVMIPTSLLAMVDASIGGKTGVDVPYGKNLIGTIYQPKYVLTDTEVLKSLPLNEMKNGIVEMIKHGLIADREYFTFLKRHAAAILSLEPEILVQSIIASCLIKKSIVEVDETETGMRRLLNLGHTVGHAVENLSNYRIPHGEAVLIGILIECFLSNRKGLMSDDELQEVIDIFRIFGINFQDIDNFTPEQILDATVMDKKSVRGRSRYIILEKIGSACNFSGEYCTYPDETLLKQAIQWYSHDMRRY